MKFISKQTRYLTTTSKTKNEYDATYAKVNICNFGHSNNLKLVS